MPWPYPIARRRGNPYVPARGQGHAMGRLIKLLLLLVVIGLAALTGYAYLGDFAPEPQTVTQPVTLDAD